MLMDLKVRIKVFLVSWKNRKGCDFGEQMGFSRKKTMSTRDYEEKNQRRINAIYGCAYSFVSAITKQRLLH
jgi:hypothetical protein